MSLSPTDHTDLLAETTCNVISVQGLHTLAQFMGYYTEACITSLAQPLCNMLFTQHPM